MSPEPTASSSQTTVDFRENFNVSFATLASLKDSFVEASNNEHAEATSFAVDIEDQLDFITSLMKKMEQLGPRGWDLVYPDITFEAEAFLHLPTTLQARLDTRLTDIYASVKSLVAPLEPAKDSGPSSGRRVMKVKLPVAPLEPAKDSGPSSGGGVIKVKRRTKDNAQCTSCIKYSRVCVQEQKGTRCVSCAKAHRKCSLVAGNSLPKKGKGNETTKVANHTVSDCDDDLPKGPPVRGIKRKQSDLSPEPRYPPPNRVHVQVPPHPRAPTSAVTPSPSEEELEAHLIEPDTPESPQKAPKIHHSIRVPSPTTAAPNLPPASVEPPSSIASPITQQELRIRALESQLSAQEKALHDARAHHIEELEHREKAMQVQLDQHRGIYEKEIETLVREATQQRQRIEALEAELGSVRSK